jgi:mannose-1-phosphate guanylyltransferase
VLFDDAQIAAGTSIRRSAIGKGARIGEGVVIDAAVIGDGAVIAEGNELRAGARVWPQVTLGPTSVRFSTDV